MAESQRRQLRSDFNDITGRRFGRWLVLGLDHEESRPKRLRWLCVCDCGKEKSVESVHLKGGRTRSCGCLRKETSAGKPTHGMSHSQEYASWQAMKTRCENPKDQKYPLYGGRGITVCERWRNSFESFFQDMGPRPAGHSLGRIDNDGPYEPNNCRWETALQQQSNKRNNHRITHEGQTHSLAEWVRITGISRDTLRYRLYHLGWDSATALTTPARGRKNI